MPTTTAGQLYGAAQALAIYQTGLAHEGLNLIITADLNQAEQLAAELIFFGATRSSVLVFPDWETLPYDPFSPHQDIVSQRLRTLYQLPQTQQGFLLVPITTLMHRIAPQSFVTGNSLILNTGQTFDLQETRRQLTDAGYRQMETVYERGEFAIRGSIIDIFPMGSENPYRIDLFDNEIDALRTFDPENQRTIDNIKSISILPGKEFPFNDQAIAQFRKNWRTHFDTDPKSCPVYQDISQKIAPSGIEYYLPLFFDNCASLLDFLPKNTLTYSIGAIDQAAAEFWREITARHEQRCHDPERPILKPSELFIPENKLFGELKSYRRIHLNKLTQADDSASCRFKSQEPSIFNLDRHSETALQTLKAHCLHTDSRTLFCAESAGRREVLLELFAQIQIKPAPFTSWEDFLASDMQFGMVVAPLDRGLKISDPAIELITEAQLFGHQVLQRRLRKKSRESSDQAIKHLAELNLGSAVVHIDHGIGHYRGLETLEVGGQQEEFLMLDYSGSDKLYVPIASLHLISRYSGADSDQITTHRLGSDKWQKAKRKAAEQIRDTAAELLEIHARRATEFGHAFKISETEYQKFCADFPFEETADQMTAIDATRLDMITARPMDRLICGDVGFGKTEVAMRAAFIAAHHGSQVAILVPTTLLAQQHFDSFKDRFADCAVQIDVLSRFRSKQEQNRIQQAIREGKVDILISTHKLFSSNIKFKNLGLLIIDEEHRFGVKQKEQIKSLRAHIDILTLTATPIPRTLNMAMSGLRDISIISSPPEKRLSIKTFVHREDNATRKEAITRELLRGGQVYLLHNDVKTIERKARDISELVPEARIGIAHGQMRERELESVMSDFYHKRFNLLVCTTIIETGIDIPSANTILIERADKLGLAQLHQLRGRVGRSHHQAYAYLLTPDHRAITADAAKRLEAIEQTQDLGAGFTLATHDLEIRGAGELLGDNQSGHIQAIGFSLYGELLEQAVKSMREGKSFNIDQPIKHGTEINLRIPALIPDSYLPDVHSRLVLYKRIANATNKDELRELQVEMIDRFGLLLEPIQNLFEISALKIKAQEMGILKIDANDAGGTLDIDADTTIKPADLISLMQQHPQKFKMLGANRLKFIVDLKTEQNRFNIIHDLLDQLNPQHNNQDRP